MIEATLFLLLLDWLLVLVSGSMWYSLRFDQQNKCQQYGFGCIFVELRTRATFYYFAFRTVAFFWSVTLSSWLRRVTHCLGVLPGQLEVQKPLGRSFLSGAQFLLLAVLSPRPLLKTHRPQLVAKFQPLFPLFHRVEPPVLTPRHIPKYTKLTSQRLEVGNKVSITKWFDLGPLLAFTLTLTQWNSYLNPLHYCLITPTRLISYYDSDTQRISCPNYLRRLY